MGLETLSKFESRGKALAVGRLPQVNQPDWKPGADTIPQNDRELNETAKSLSDPYGTAGPLRLRQSMLRRRWTFNLVLRGARSAC